MFFHAVPFLIPLILAPLLGAALYLGDWWIAGAAAFAFIAAPLIDQITSHHLKNLDPAMPEARLIWHKWVTWIWVPVQLALILSALFVVGRTDWLQGWEVWAVAASLGIATGGIGITYAHELMHQKSRLERQLAEILMCSTLYGHFCIEHIFGHHVNVATSKDPATARAGESLYAFLPRTIILSLVSAWRIQTHQLTRRGKPVWSLANAFWRYAAWTVFWFALSYAIAGWTGVLLFTIQAGVAVIFLEIVNYVEHYGLTRQRLPNGKYEPTQPHHSWNCNHRMTNYLLLNLQRHSDHHFKPSRRFPLLQAYGEDEAPQLPFGYSLMMLISLFPPLWFQVMNPKLETWRAQFQAP